MAEVTVILSRYQKQFPVLNIAIILFQPNLPIKSPNILFGTCPSLCLNVTVLQFDGVHVVSGSLDTSIRVWEVESGSCKHTLMGHQSLTSGMELRNNILVSGNADSTVKVWDILTGQCLQTLSGMFVDNFSLSTFVDNFRFASSFCTGPVTRFQLLSRKCQMNFGSVNQIQLWRAFC